MVSGLGVKADPAGTGIGKSDGEFIDRRDHQVHVDRRRHTVVAQRAADHRANGEVGDIVVVHHIEVNDVGTGREHRIDLGAKAREVGRKNRRGDQEVGHGGFPGCA